MKDATITVSNGHPLALNAAPGSNYLKARFATTADDVRRALELRYSVFIEEMDKGHKNTARRDEEDLDKVCKHLIVENLVGEVVGTYRLQTWNDARKHGRGLYSAGEFDMGPFDAVSSKILELGRACVTKKDRGLPVITLLWKGIGEYIRESGCEYMLGCSSLSTIDPATAASAYKWLVDNGHLVEERFRTTPHASGACRLDKLSPEKVKIPSLFRAYLKIVGAKICGPPCIDGEFRTTDFLTFVDIAQMPQETRVKFIGT